MLPEVVPAVERAEPVGVSQPGGGVHVPGAAGGAAGPRPGDRSRGQVGSGLVHGAEADDGGHPAAQRGRHPREPPVEQRRAAAGQPQPVDRRPERRLDPRHRPGHGQQQAIPQGWPGGEALAAQPGPDRGAGAPRGAEAGLDAPRAEEVAEPGRAGGGDLGGQPVEAARVGGAQRHRDVQSGRTGLRAGDRGARGNPRGRGGRAHRGGPRRGHGRAGAGCPPRPRWPRPGPPRRSARPQPGPPCTPATPAASASPVPRDSPFTIKGMLEELSAAAGDPTIRALPARSRACCS